MTTVIKSVHSNMHESPAFGSMVINQGIIWEEVTVLETNGDWIRIELPDGYKGWVQAFTLQELDESMQTVCHRSRKLLIETPYTQIKSYRNEEGGYDKVGMTAFGARFPVKQDKGSWTEIWLPDGRSGWIQQASTPALSTRDRIIYHADKMLGTPYLWGGRSENGYDCSGFVQSLFSACGLKVPRDAYMQKDLLADFPVSSGDILPGDLAFFKNEKGRINHVAVMFSRDSFIHASGEVKRNSFDPESPIFSEKLKNILEGIYSINNLL